MATTVAALPPTTLFRRRQPEFIPSLTPKWHAFSRKPPCKQVLSVRSTVSARFHFPRVPFLRPATPDSTTDSCIGRSDGEVEVSWKDAVAQVLRALSKPAAVALVVGLILFASDPAALAASGGRMGGRSFSAPSGGSLSRSYSAPSRSAFSYSVPYYAPSPFGGVYVGPAFGFGVGAGSGFFLLMAGFAAMVLLSGFLSDRSDDGSVLTATQKTSVLKLQVGLLGMARTFQRDLDRIAEVADTSTPEGLSYVLTETTLALLRHPDCCISGYSSFDIKRSIEDGEKRFNQLSIEERGKFDEETLVNINSIRRQSAGSLSSKGFSNEYIVVRW